MTSYSKLKLECFDINFDTGHQFCVIFEWYYQRPYLLNRVNNFIECFRYQRSCIGVIFSQRVAEMPQNQLKG